MKSLKLDKEFDLIFILSIIAFMILMICSNLLINKMNRRDTKIKLILENFFAFRSNFGTSFTKFGLIFIFYKIFQMFFKILFSNFLNTLKVLVDTSNIISSLDKFTELKYEVCFSEEQITNRILPKSIERRILNGLNEMHRNRCLINVPKLKETIDLKGKALLWNSNNIHIFLSIYAMAKPNLNYWLLDRSIFDYITVSYYRIGLTRTQIDLIAKFAMNRLEFGIDKNFFKNLNNLIKFKLNNQIFTNLNQFIESNTIFYNLNLKAYQFVLVALFCLQFLICFLFLIRFFLVFLEHFDNYLLIKNRLIRKINKKSNNYVLNY